jgi:hypothetical protein
MTQENLPPQSGEEISPAEPSPAPPKSMYPGSLAKHALNLSLLITAIGTMGLLWKYPATAPWYLVASLIVLGNGALWAWIIQGWLGVDGARKTAMIRALLGKIAVLGMILVLALTLRSLDRDARLAVLAGLLTPLLGLVLTALFHRPKTAA